MDKMDIQVVYFILALVVIGVCSNEYCQTDDFAPQCNSSQILLIQSAKLGRMYPGKCIPGTFGSLDCEKDMQLILDIYCSGRTDCQIPVIQFVLDYPDICPRGVTVFLDVEHTCINVEVFSSCPAIGSSLLTKPEGYLSSTSIISTGVGSPICPWIIRVKPGQTLEIRFFDFTLYQLVTQVRQAMGDDFECPFSVDVVEMNGMSTSLSLCDTSQRERNLYTSETEEITLSVNVSTSFSTGDPPYYMVVYQTLGCPNIEPPEGAIVEYNGNAATVKCNETGEQWFLVCYGRKREWDGEFQNCTEGKRNGQIRFSLKCIAIIETDTGGQNGESTPRKFPFGDNDVIGILIAVAIGVGIGIVIGFSLLGLVIGVRRCIEARKSKKKKQNATANARDLSQIEVPRGKLPELPAKEGKYSRTPSDLSSTEEGIYQVPATPPQHIYDTRVATYQPAMQHSMQQPMHPQEVPGPSDQRIYSQNPYQGVLQRRLSDGSDAPQPASTAGTQPLKPGSFRRIPGMDVRHIYETTANFNRSFGKGSFRKSVDMEHYHPNMHDIPSMHQSQRPMSDASVYSHGHRRQESGSRIYDGVENLRY